MGMKRKIKEKKYIYLITFAILLAVFMRILIVYLTERVFLFDILTFIGTMLGVLPLFIYKYLEYRRIKDIEERFPDFLRDLAGSREAGMTLPYALIHISKLDYGYLTPEIKKIADQISWGIPLRKAFENFSRRIKSKHVQRSTSIIIEADRSGGKITAILEAVARFSRVLREIEKEQIGTLRTYTIIIYFSYVVFIVIIVLLLRTLLSGLAQLGGVVTPVRIQEFNKLLFRMTIIQGVFTGLVAGKVGEGTILDGIKHSFILAFIGFLSFEIFIW